MPTLEDRDAARAELGRALSAGLAAEDPAAVRTAFERLTALGFANGRINAAVGAFAARTGQPEMAEQAFAAVLRDRPDDPAQLHARGVARLRAGRWADGWRDFEARLETHRLLPFEALRDAGTGSALPRWRIGEPRPESLLVFAEQGAGDTIQCARFALRLAAQGVEIQVAASPRLAALVAALGLDVVQPSPDAAFTTPAQRWCAMMSLPGLMGATSEDDLRAPPYFRLERSEGRPLRSRPQVGVVWQGNPRHPGDAARSIPLEALLPLLEIRDWDWASLQVSDGLEQLGVLPPHVTLAAGPDGDGPPFIAAARRVAGMDLVVAIDSAVAHMAGAMGVPCALLLPPHHRDWRWQDRRTDSPWYESIRVFRRDPAETWRDFVARSAPEIRAMAEGQRGVGAEPESLSQS
jgi:hypothetical protein